MAYDAGAVIGRAILDDSQWEKGSKNVQKSTTNMVGSLFTAQAAFAAVQKVVQEVTKVIRESIKVSIDYQEANSKFGTVFKQVSKQANEVRKSLVDNFGLSRKAATELLSATGDLLTGFNFLPDAALQISKQVNELAVDLASFTNAQGGAEAVSAALTKALLGERESLKTYGIAIMEADIQARLLEKGMQNLTGEALRQAKAQATLELAMEQSKNAIGDFARTSDQLANLQRVQVARFEDLQVVIGGLFIPALADATRASIKFEKAILNLVESKEFMIDFGTASNLVVSVFTEFFEILQTSGISMIETFKESFGGAVSEMDLGSEIAGFLIEIFADLGQKIELVTAVVNFYIKAYSNLFNLFSNSISVVKNLGKALLDAFGISEALQNANIILESFINNIKFSFVDLFDLKGTISANIDSIKEFFKSVSYAVLQIFKDVKNLLPNEIQKIIEFYFSIGKSVFSFFVNISKSIGSFFIGVIEKAASFISNLVEPVLIFFQPVIDIIEKIVQFFQDLGEKVTGFFNKSEFDDFKKSVEGFNNATKKLSTDTIKDLGDVVKEASDVYNPLDKTTRENTKRITEQWEKTNQEMIEGFKDTGSELVDETKNTTNKIENTLTEGLKEKFLDSLEESINIGEFFKELKKGVDEGIVSTSEAFKMGFEKIADEILSKIQFVIEQVADIYNSISGIVIDSMQNELTALKEKNAAEIEELEEQKEKKLEQLDEEGESKLEILEQQREAGIISEEEFQEREKALEEDTANRKAELDKKLSEQILATKKKQIEKENAMEKKIFEAEKANQIANVWISAALGIVAAWAQSIAQLGPIAGAIFAGILTAAILGVAIAQTVVISQQQFIPKKAKGGMASGLTEINEGGRGEIVNLPDNSLVIPNDISRQIAENVGANNGNMINVSFKGAVISDALSLKKVTDHVMQRLSLEMRRG